MAFIQTRCLVASIAIATFCCGFCDLLVADDSPPATGFFQLLDEAAVVAPTKEAGENDAANITIEIRGRILDAGGQPMADALVAVVASRSSDVLARTRTDAEGEYRFDDVRYSRPSLPRANSDGSVTLVNLVAATAQGQMNWEPIQYFVYSRSSNRVRFEFLDDEPIPGSLRFNQDISLGQSHVLSGIVLDPNDAPVPNVQIELPVLLKSSPEASGAEEVSRFFAVIGKYQAITDAQGEFRFDGVPGGMVAFAVLEHPDYYRATASLATSPEVTGLPSNYANSGAEPLSHSPARLHLIESVIVRGKIVNAKQEPLPGADIRNHFTNQSETKSDAEGNFAVAVSSQWVAGLGDRANVTRFELKWPDDSPYADSTPLLSRQRIVENEPLTIIAEDAIEIRGHVIASDDQQPVAELPVRIEAWQASRPRVIETRTNSEGRFTVKASAGRWLVTCGPKPGFDLLAKDKSSNLNDAIDPRSQRIIDLIDDEQPSKFAILIDRMPSLAVSAVDPDGQPIVGAEVSFWRMAEGSSGRFLRGSSIQSLVPDGITGSDGVCKVPLPTLVDENWVITACSPAVAPRLFAVKEIRSNRGQPIELTLTPGVPVRGRVLLDGSPLANATLRLTETSSFGSNSASSTWLSTVKTSDDGQYELFVPSPDAGSRIQIQSDYTVQLVGIPEFTQCRRPMQRVRNTAGTSAAADASKSLDFNVVTARGEASGRIVDESGAPIAGAVVRAHPNFTRFGDPIKQAYATSDESGVFRWFGLGTGRFRPVVVIHGKPISPEITIQAGQESVEIVVNEDGSASLDSRTPKPGKTEVKDASS